MGWWVGRKGQARGLGKEGVGDVKLELKESWGRNWGAWLWASAFSVKSVGSGSGTLSEGGRYGSECTWNH